MKLMKDTDWMMRRRGRYFVLSIPAGDHEETGSFFILYGGREKREKKYNYCTRDSELFTIS